jgi:hypothetical protein
MNPLKDNKKLVIFFEDFAAQNNLDEAHLEKLERVLHLVKPKSMGHIKTVCSFIVKHELQNLPEDEILDRLREDKMF